MQGTIKNIVPDRGFGFISPDGGGDDVFVHITKYSDPQYPFDEQITGMRVEFDVELDRSGRQRALNVRRAT